MLHTIPVNPCLQQPVIACNVRDQRCPVAVLHVLSTALSPEMLANKHYALICGRPKSGTHPGSAWFQRLKRSWQGITWLCEPHTTHTRRPPA